MFSTRPDAQSFTKFLVTAGVFLIIAAVVVPGLILRETDVLKLPQSDLDQATEVGRAELERRQRVARDVGESTPWIVGVLFVSGLALVIYGTPRLRKQEAAQEERAQVDLEEARGRLQPQTREERRQKLTGEVAADLESEFQALFSQLGGSAKSGGIPPVDEREEEAGSTAGEEPAPEEEPASTQEPAPDGEEPAPTTEEEAAERLQVSKEAMERARRNFERALEARLGNTRDVGYRVRRAARVEKQVIEHMSANVREPYEFRSELRDSGMPPLQLDGVFVSHVLRQPDVVVEIKASAADTLRKNLMRWLSDTDALRLRYAERIGRETKGFLVVVLPQGDGLDIPALDRLEEVREQAPHLRVAVVGEDEIGLLPVPPFHGA